MKQVAFSSSDRHIFFHEIVCSDMDHDVSEAGRVELGGGGGLQQGLCSVPSIPALPKYLHCQGLLSSKASFLSNPYLESRPRVGND